jgi:hypothetical protein
LGNLSKFVYICLSKIKTMKKVFIALSLVLFVGSYATTAYAASNGVNIEIVKKEDKKKKKNKKGSCSEKSAEAKSCTKGEKKACCAKKEEAK